MRSLPPELTAALESGSYQPYFKAIISDLYTGIVLASETPVYYKLENLTLTIKIQRGTYLTVAISKTTVVLTRGVTISGVNYTIDTSDFVITNSQWDGIFQTFECHLIPENYYSAPGDLSYSTVIQNFCTTFGKTAVFPNPVPAWCGYQFLPTGKTATFNNAQNFFTLLRQKYFIFATDNGDNEIFFYAAFQHAAAAQYQIQCYKFDIDHNTGKKRQYLWRDEIYSLHQTTPSFNLIQQLGAETYLLSFVELDDRSILAGTYPNGKIYKSSNYGATWTQKTIPASTGVYAFSNLGDVTVLAASQFNIYKSLDYGETWTLLSTLASSIISLSNLGNGILLAGSQLDGKVYRSTNYGATWTLIGQLGAETWIHAIEHLEAGIVLAGTEPNGKIYKSTDYGATWTLIQQLGATIRVLSLLSLGSGIVLAGAGGYIYKSTDYGATWTLIQQLGAQSRIFALDSLGNGVISAGTFPNGQVYKSTNYGATWTLIQQLGAETDVRGSIALTNQTVLAGTGPNCKVYKSSTFDAELNPIHNLGFMPSTAVEPDVYFQNTPPEILPIPVHLKYQSSDYIDLLLQPSGTLPITSLQVTELLDISKPSMAWRMIITETEWISNTVGGALPGTIERVAAYTPLVTTGFDKNLTPAVNNLQALAEAVDELHGVTVLVTPFAMTTTGGILLEWVALPIGTYTINPQAAINKSLPASIKGLILLITGRWATAATTTHLRIFPNPASGSAPLIARPLIANFDHSMQGLVPVGTGSDIDVLVAGADALFVVVLCLGYYT
jgi:photosystem II stability/assembly factor-like uncharacterized protein